MMNKKPSIPNMNVIVFLSVTSGDTFRQTIQFACCHVTSHKMDSSIALANCGSFLDEQKLHLSER